MSSTQIGGHAFISYVREDSPQVDRLQRTLEDAGVPVWRDKSQIWPGEDWRARIREAISSEALAFLACFSSNSVARKASYHNAELLLAIDQLRLRRPDQPWLIPVRFDDCPISDQEIGGGRTLSSIHRADVFGDDYHDSVAMLLAAIERILRDSRAAPARPALRQQETGIDQHNTASGRGLTIGTIAGSAFIGEPGPATGYGPNPESDVTALAAAGAAVISLAMGTSNWPAILAELTQIYGTTESSRREKISEQLDRDHSFVRDAPNGPKAREAMRQLWELRLEELLRIAPVSAARLDALIKQCERVAASISQSNTAQDEGTVIGTIFGNVHLRHDPRAWPQ